MMIRTQIYIPSHLHQEAKNIAQRKNESLAKLLRELIASGLIKEKTKLQTKSLSSLEGLNISGGLKDISRHMDKYLYDE